MKITITTTEKEARLIQKALDLYVRMSMGQFNCLTDVPTIQKLVDQQEDDSFLIHAEGLKPCIGLRYGTSYSIFSRKVEDDAKIAQHIQEQIRHEIWKQQPDPKFYTSNEAFPACCCQTAGIEVPNFEILTEKDK